MTDLPTRTRLVLVSTSLREGPDGIARMRAALEAGDVASVLLDPAGRDATAFQRFAEPLVPLIQEHQAAAIVVDETQVAGRLKADGLHVTGGDREALRDAVSRFSPKLIVGGSGFETRHGALEAGEALPDYLFFGRLGGDSRPDAHPKNLRLAEWWADIVEVPCILLAGGTVASVREAAATGAEFVALSSAVFGEGADPQEAVRTANAMLDESAEGVAA